MNYISKANNKTYKRLPNDIFNKEWATIDGVLFYEIPSVFSDVLIFSLTMEEFYSKILETCKTVKHENLNKNKEYFVFCEANKLFLIGKVMLVAENGSKVVLEENQIPLFFTKEIKSENKEMSETKTSKIRYGIYLFNYQLYENVITVENNAKVSIKAQILKDFCKIKPIVKIDRTIICVSEIIDKIRIKWEYLNGKKNKE